MFDQRSCLVLVALSACAVAEPPQTAPTKLFARRLSPGDTLAVSWSPTGVNRDSNAGTVACTTTISHPCPFLHYTQTMIVADDGATISWTDATGGTDLANVPAENRLPWVDDLRVGTDGTLQLHQRGDDGGLRHEATLTPVSVAPGGYAGEVTWSLFNAPAYTTFSVSLVFD